MARDVSETKPNGTGHPEAHRTRATLREPYVWLLILFPALAVVGGITTFIIAATTFDGLVADDYYQRGKRINRVLRRDQAAVRLGLHADLQIDPGGKMLVNLKSAGIRAPDAEIQLSVSYATQSGFDQHITLQRTGSEATYYGHLQPLRRGKWTLQLHTDEWRLLKTLQSPLQERYTLQAR